MLAGYQHPHFGRFPALVTADHGRGRITTVGTLPNPELAADLLRWLVPAERRPWAARPPSTTVHSATNASGERIHVVHNWAWEPATLDLPAPMLDVLVQDSAEPLDVVRLGPWDVRVLREP